MPSGPLQRFRALRRRLLVCVVALCAGALARPATAQGSPPVDLNLLALAWAQGSFGAPLVCEVEGNPVRAIRKLVIAAEPGTDRGVMDRIRFVDPEARGATRCFSELGGDEPLVSGTLLISLPGRSRPDTARYDLEATLKREGGFDFDIREGSLSVRGWGPGQESPTLVDFSGGVARVHAIAPGSDAERLLRDFASKRKLLLVLEAKDGTVLRFHIFQIGGR